MNKQIEKRKPMKMYSVIFTTLAMNVALATPSEQHTLKRGQTFRLELPSNPSTGYSWYFAKPIEKNQILTMIKSGYEAPQTNRIGASGKQFWTLKGRYRGVANLTLEYKRAWEKNEKPAEIRRYTFKVE